MVVIWHISSLIVHPAFHHLIIFHRPLLTMILLRHTACLHLLLSLTHPYGSAWFSKISVICYLNKTNQDVFWTVCLLWYTYVPIHYNLISKSKMQLVDLEHCGRLCYNRLIFSPVFVDWIIDTISVYALSFSSLCSDDALFLGKFYCPFSHLY